MNLVVSSTSEDSGAALARAAAWSMQNIRDHVNGLKSPWELRPDEFVKLGGAGYWCRVLRVDPGRQVLRLHLEGFGEFDHVPVPGHRYETHDGPF